MTHMTGPFLQLTGPFLTSTLLLAMELGHQQHEDLFALVDPMATYNIWLETISLPAALTVAESQ